MDANQQDTHYSSAKNGPKTESTAFAPRRAGDGVAISRREPASRVDGWRFIRPLLFFYLFLLGSQLIAGWMLSAGMDPSLVYYFEGLDALVTLGLAVRYRRDLLPLVAVRWSGWKPLVTSAGAFLGFVLVMTGAFASLEAIGVPFQRLTDPGDAAWVSYLTLSVVPAVWEELAFRGVLHTRLQYLFTQREALFVQAALFSVLHLSPIIFVTHFAMGLAFGWLKIRHASLYPGLLLHALWNGLTVYHELGVPPW